VTVVYLDNAATTAADPRVIEAMLACLGSDGAYANASAVNHAPGRAARARIENARAEVAALVGVDPAQVVWTSGATEANNLALLGAARFHRSRGRHVLTSRTEHAAVLDPCRQLEREGFSVTYLRPRADGIVDAAQVAEALRPDTLLVSLMHVNNETGVIQDVAAVGRLCRERGVLFHVDAAQSAGKLAVNMRDWGIDLLALTAHKLHGPKGIGALCVGTRGWGSCRCSSAGARSAACARARCPRTRSSAWALRSRSPAPRWMPMPRASPRCATVSGFSSASSTACC
jgi:cysteine desulfurase